MVYYGKSPPPKKMQERQSYGKTVGDPLACRLAIYSLVKTVIADWFVNLRLYQAGVNGYHQALKKAIMMQRDTKLMTLN